MPSSLVAQVDSAYGGKTGVDLPEAKNYVGAYHLPLAVLADPATLETLPPGELAAGFVEVVKPSGFNVKDRRRQAAEYRLTMHHCDVTRAPPSKAFMRWQPEEKTFHGAKIYALRSN